MSNEQLNPNVEEKKCQKVSENLKERIPRWENYKDFFQITVLRYLVLWFTVVPLVAQLTRDIHSSSILVAGEPIVWHLELSLPFSWQILWLSSFLFFLALGIYHLRCPTFIKKYNSFSDYKSYGHDPRWLAWLARSLIKHIKNNKELRDKFTKRLEDKKYLVPLADNVVINENDKPIVAQNQTKYRFEGNGKKFELAMPVMIGGVEITDAVRGIFWEIFGIYSGSRSIARGTILFLLLLSGLSFLYVLSEHIWSGLALVLKLFFHH